jgi:hypothetical protein
MRYLVPAAVLPLVLLLGAARADQPRFAAEVPFTVCDDGLICVPVTVDGKQKETLILDTGNDNSFFSAATAETLGWKLDPAKDDSGKTMPNIFTSDHTVQLGAVSLKLQMVLIKRSKPAAPRPYQGSLAYTDLKDRVVQIDYPHHLLRISEVQDGPAPAAAPGELKAITFGRQGPPILTGGPFSVNGHSLRAQIDTCYTGSLLIYDAAVPSLGLQEMAGKGTPRQFPHTDGGVTMLGAPVQSIGFAGHDFALKNPTVYFPTPGVHQPDGLFEGTVGNELLQDSVVTLDLHRMTLDIQVGA